MTKLAKLDKFSTKLLSCAIVYGDIEYVKYIFKTLPIKIEYQEIEEAVKHAVTLGHSESVKYVLRKIKNIKQLELDQLILICMKNGYPELGIWIAKLKHFY